MNEIISQNNYKELANSITDIYFAMDINLVYTFWNKASEQFTGIKSEFAVGKSIDEIFPEHDELNKTKETYLDVIRTKQPKSFISKFFTDTRTFHFEINAYPSENGLHVIVKDITEKIESENRINEIIKFQENLLNTVNTIIICLDSEGFIVMINKFGLELLGYSEIELIGKNWFETVLPQPESMQIVYPVFLRIISGELEKVRYFENDIITKQGVRLTIAWSNNYLQTSENNIMIISSGNDITARKKAEKENTETMQRLIFANKATNDVIWDWNVQDNTQRWNEAGIEVFGWREIVEHPVSAEWWVERVHPDDRERIHETFFAVVNNPERHYWKDEYLFLKADGNYANVIDRGYVLRDNDGNAFRMIGAMQDITSKKQSEKKLQELNMALEQSIDGIALTDLDGNLRFLNKACAEMHDYTPDELTGKHLSLFHSTEQMKNEVIPFLEKLNNDGYFEGEVSHIRKNGEEFPTFMSTSVVFDNHSETFGMLAIMKDISDIKQHEVEKEKLQAQLYQSQKMESVGRLAGGVAHDFNNMLGVIIGNSELAMLNLENKKLLTVNIEEIQKAANRSANLTRQLLSFARKQTIQPKVIILNDTIEDMLKMLRRLIGEDIDLIWKPANTLWKTWIDPVQIDQILANLCVNARDAIINIGKITIETKNIIIDDKDSFKKEGFKSGDFVMLSISDNGCGMDETMQAHLFEPFYTTKEMGKGTGLGLATVYGAVKQNNGFIDVFSKINKGTTFKIYFPRYTDIDTEKTESTKKQKVFHGNGTILLVEDEASILNLITKMLEHLGYSILSADSAEKALELAKKNAINLLITDVVMPKVNGFDLAKTILQTQPEMKQLFMSGYTADVITNQGVLKKDTPFIQKPFSISELSAKIKEILEG